MADHGQVEYATAEGNDLPAHEAMYDRFVHLVFGRRRPYRQHRPRAWRSAPSPVTGLWPFGIFVIATIVAMHGFMSGARPPSVIMVVISLLALALTSGG